jgi:hypothetical protein
MQGSRIGVQPIGGLNDREGVHLLEVANWHLEAWLRRWVFGSVLSLRSAAA